MYFDVNDGAKISVYVLLQNRNSSSVVYIYTVDPGMLVNTHLSWREL